MTIDLLDTPLRVTWDLHGPSGAMEADAARRVTDELVTAGIFFATLQQRPMLHPLFSEVLDSLAGGGARTFVTCDGSDRELAGLRPGMSIAAVFLDAHPFLSADRPDIPALTRAVTRLRDLGYDPALMLTPLQSNIAALPALLDFCREQQVGKFKLPNIRIDDSFWRSVRSSLLRPEDVENLRLLFDSEGRDRCSGPHLEIHDLFLWEVLSPDREDGRSEYGGCQAGNSLAHIDAAGDLYPCSSWPERLGSLLQFTLEDLWRTPERFRVRESIAAVPKGCLGCRDYPVCFGGCRGLARTLHGDDHGRDPLCGGLR